MKTKQVFVVRQGDVLLVRAGSGTKAGKPIARDKGRIVLAYGELTGHAHAISAKNAELCELDEIDRLLKVTGKPVMLRHEEHDAIEIPPGLYRVRLQKEWSPEALRNVAD